MPYNVIYKLEQICKKLNDQNITVITWLDLERIIIQDMNVVKEKTIKRYVIILEKLQWIKSINKKDFEITYRKKGDDIL